MARADVIAYAASRPSNGADPFGLLDLTTGAFTQIAALPNLFVADLAVAQNGTVYMLTGPLRGSGSELSTINPTNGAITNIAAEPTTINNSIAFNSNGTLYATGVGASGPETLYTLNTTTGAASVVGNLSGADASTASQIRFIGNTLYTTTDTAPSGLYTIDTGTGAGTLVGSNSLGTDNGLGAVVNGQLVAVGEQSTAAYQLFTINPSNGALTSGAALNNFYVFAVAPEVGLGNLAGGSSASPAVLFSAQPVGQITGTIGAAGSQDYYSFSWAGGAFSASASITGANTSASYLFSEGVSGSCNGGGSATLDNTDNFTGMISIANLAPGSYCIGLNADSPNDPAYTLTFDTPLAAQTPEPGSLLLMFVGFGAMGGAMRLKRPR
jgi:hypothetical protein